MTPRVNSRWNRVLVFAVVTLFVLNTWLVGILINFKTPDEHMSEESHTIENVKMTNKRTAKQTQVLSPDSRLLHQFSSAHVDKNKSIVLGHRKKTKDFLTVAIPTVKRNKESYLRQTLDSIIETTSLKDRTEVTVVIFAANRDEKLNNLLKAELETAYREHFRSGFMQLITAPSSFYPPLNNLKQNYGDSKERVGWRAKQVVDFAFMFSHCQGLSEYYIQLEDDVISSTGFVHAIKRYLEVQKGKKWTMLEFSELGFIGKLFRSSELPRLSQFMLLFYEEQPVDYLMSSYIKLNVQEGLYKHVPSLFQHIGVESSLKNKKQHLKDRYFVRGPQMYQSDNPPAELYSSMEAFDSHTPELAYSSNSDYFWAKMPKMGDIFLIVFKSPVKLSRVVVETGSKANPEDYLRAGKLEASSWLVSSNTDGRASCADYRPVGEFVSGRLDEGNLEKRLNFSSKCLQITVTKGQQEWLLIREIAVFVHGYQRQ